MAKRIINYKIFSNNIEFIEWQLADEYEGIISISPYTKPLGIDFSQKEKTETVIEGEADIEMEQGVFVVYTEKAFEDEDMDVNGYQVSDEDAAVLRDGGL